MTKLKNLKGICAPAPCIDATPFVRRELLKQEAKDLMRLIDKFYDIKTIKGDKK